MSTQRQSIGKQADFQLGRVGLAGSQAGGIGRRHRVRPRSIVLSLMFVAPLVFMLYGTTMLTGRNGLQQRRSDLQFIADDGYAPRLVDPYMAAGFARQANKPLAGPPSVSTAAPNITGNGGGEASAGSGLGGELGAGSTRRRVARKLISSDDGAAAVQLSEREEGSSGSAAAGHSQRLWPCQQLREPAPGEPRAWLYTLLGADYEGTAELLPHWLRHYVHTLGFSCERLLVVVNHHSNRPEAAAELAAVQRVLEDWGIQHLLWTGRYSSDAHLKIKLQLLDQKVKSVDDWIVIADSDEFHSYTDGGTISEMLKVAEQQGSNWVLGQLMDRVSPTGELAPVQEEPSLFEQFPLNCHVVRQVSKGSVRKVMASKAYWRTNTGNHYVVEPDMAREYYSGAEPGTRNPRGGWFGAEDLWHLTPYSKNYHRYQFSYATESPGLWRLSQYPTLMPVFHFKWHHGVLQSAADRYQHYSGNVSQPGGFPRYKHYNESSNILEALSTGRIDIEALQCSRETPVLGERPPQ